MIFTTAARCRLHLVRSLPTRSAHHLSKRSHPSRLPSLSTAIFSTQLVSVIVPLSSIWNQKSVLFLDFATHSHPGPLASSVHNLLSYSFPYDTPERQFYYCLFLSLLEKPILTRACALLAQSRPVLSEAFLFPTLINFFTLGPPRSPNLLLATLFHVSA